MSTATASLKFRTESLHGAMPVTRTEFVSGRNTRNESRSCNGVSDSVPPVNVRYEYGPLRAYIQNRDLGYGFELDLEAKVYTAWRANEYGSPAWIQPRAVPQTQRSGSTVHRATETIPTGDRRQAFGYTARRVITKSTETKDGQLRSESETDGWYIDPPAAWSALHPPSAKGVFYVLTSGGKRDDYTFTEKGERESGFPILIVRTSRSYISDAKGVIRSDESSWREEVVELSEAGLDPALFTPPLDFRRLMQLPGGYRYPLSNRLRLRWEMLKDSWRLQRMARA